MRRPGTWRLFGCCGAELNPFQIYVGRPGSRWPEVEVFEEQGSQNLHGGNLGQPSSAGTIAEALRVLTEKREPDFTGM